MGSLSEFERDLIHRVQTLESKVNKTEAGSTTRYYLSGKLDAYKNTLNLYRSYKLKGYKKPYR